MLGCLVGKKNGFGLGFWVCHWRLQRSSAWGCFGSSFPKTPPSQFSEMNFRTVPEVHFFFVFSFVSHINRFRLFTGSCQTSQHASDRRESPRLRRLDASGRRRSWRRPRDGGRDGDAVSAFHRTWWRVHLLQALGVGWLGYLLPASERRRMRMRMRRRSYWMLTLQAGRRRSRRSRRWIAFREGLLTLPC